MSSKSLQHNEMEAQSNIYAFSRDQSTHCGLLMPYGDMDLGNIGSGNGLLPDGTKPLSEQMLTYHQ